MTDRIHYRESLIDLLHEIASTNPQESFVEMVCLWFDDLYLPGRDPAPYSTDIWNRGIREFNGCFNQVELNALEAFHHIFDQCERLIPDRTTSAELAENGDWKVIREGASRALEAFGNKGRRLEV